MTDLSLFVPQYYVMDPNTEVVNLGEDLENGMKILSEDDHNRVDTGSSAYEKFISEREKALRWNRWMTIRCFEIVDHDIFFIGTYDDGTQKQFACHKKSGWYVKKDSIPPVPVPLRVTPRDVWESLQDLTDKVEDMAKQFANFVAIVAALSPNFDILAKFIDPKQNPNLVTLLIECGNQEMFEGILENLKSVGQESTYCNPATCPGPECLGVHHSDDPESLAEASRQEEAAAASKFAGGIERC